MDNQPPCQIGAAAFMEAGSAAVNGGARRSMAAIVDHGRRDSGFVRYVCQMWPLPFKSNSEWQTKQVTCEAAGGGSGLQWPPAAHVHRLTAV